MKQAETALMVIDMQADYIGKKSRRQYYPTMLVDKINERIAAAVRHGDMVIYVRNTGRRNKEPYISDFAEGLLVVSDYIVEKERASIFTAPILPKLLKENHINKIECIGIDGNCCVASSAIEASELGFSVRFPLEYIGIKNRERFFKTREKLKKANVQIIGDE